MSSSHTPLQGIWTGTSASCFFGSASGNHGPLLSVPCRSWNHGTTCEICEWKSYSARVKLFILRAQPRPRFENRIALPSAGQERHQSMGLLAAIMVGGFPIWPPTLRPLATSDRRHSLRGFGCGTVFGSSKERGYGLPGSPCQVPCAFSARLAAPARFSGSDVC